MKSRQSTSDAPSGGQTSSSLPWLLHFVFSILAVLGLTSATFFATPAGAATTSGSGPASTNRVTFGIGPASATGFDGRSDFSFGVTPGGVLFDHVALLNYSTVPLTLQLYTRDALETPGGGFGLLPAAATSRGVGTWISGPAGSATQQVPPKTASGPGQVVVPFTLHVPADASPGDHVGGIIASLQTVGKNASGGRVVLDQRVGTRVFVRVSGQIVPKVTVTSVSATYAGTPNPFGQGSVSVRYVVTNAGNVDIRLKGQSVSVSGIVADTRHAGKIAVPLLLPGSSVSENVTLPSVWPQFRLHATVAVQPLVLSATTTTSLAPVSGSASLWAVPWTLIALILILLAIGIYLRRRRRHGPPTPPSPQVERVPVSV